MLMHLFWLIIVYAWFVRPWFHDAEGNVKMECRILLNACFFGGIMRLNAICWSLRLSKPKGNVVQCANIRTLR